MKMQDYYLILGIDSSASDMEIKKAFRKKVKSLHPSLNKDADALEQFILVNEAYEILIHHNTRRVYEEDLKTHLNPMFNEHYSYWIKQARTLALQHSELSWQQYSNSKFYKGTHTTPYILFLLGLIAGIVVLAVPVILLMFLKDNPALGVLIFFLSLPVGLFLVIQGLAGFAALKKHTWKH